MLGKTNITALSEGAVVTEIEDFRWIQMQSGVYGNFARAIYKNGYLAAITADGAVVYTKDGEVWQASAPGYTNCRMNDIEWDGSRFILAGGCTDEGGEMAGLVLATADFSVFEKIEVPPTTHTVNEYALIYYENNGYTLIDVQNGYGVYAVHTDFLKITSTKVGDRSYNAANYSVAKSTDGILVYVHCKSSSGSSNLHYLYKTEDGGVEFLKNYDKLGETGINTSKKAVTVFECKDTLYAMGLLSQMGYSLEKATAGNEVMTMCTGQNFMFVDGVYFNGSQVFINNHEMLVVKKGESLADKTTDDLVEIAPELTMNCITKAFGQIYIFGNQGVILKSSVETDNESAILVQALSAKKALAQAMAYVDEKLGNITPAVKETVFVTNNGDLVVQGIKGTDYTDITDIFIKSNTYKEGMVVGVSTNGMGYIIAQNFTIDCSKLTDSERVLIQSFDYIRFSRANDSDDYPLLKPSIVNYEAGYGLTGKNGYVKSTIKIQVGSNSEQNYFQYQLPSAFRNDDSSNLLFSTIDWSVLNGINVKNHVSS